MSVRPLREALNFAYDIVRAGFVLLLAVVGTVLMIACVNVAGLTLARSTARGREVAIRMSLGAGRARLTRQLLMESAVLALAGGGLGIALTYLAVDVIGPRLPEVLYRVGTATVDGRVLAFSAALTLATPILFGLTPALSATRISLATAMKEGGRGTGAGRQALHRRRGLVVAQVALAVVLLTAAGYFEVMGIPLVAGRDFGAIDRPDAPPAVIVSRALAERHWPGESPVGRMLLLPDGEGTLTATVVGVVEDVRHEGITEAPRPQLYRSLSHAPTRRRFLVVAAEGGEPVALTARVREALAGVDPNVPATIRPMSEIVLENDFKWRIGSTALGAFGAVALLLAALGLYGVVTYSVAQRRRELGIRLALGATAAQLRSLVVRDGVRLTGAGVAVGVILAIAAARLLASQLFGVPPFDPLTFAIVPVLFAAVAALASARPAARAAGLPPQDVLREE